MTMPLTAFPIAESDLTAAVLELADLHWAGVPAIIVRRERAAARLNPGPDRRRLA